MICSLSVHMVLFHLQGSLLLLCADTHMHMDAGTKLKQIPKYTNDCMHIHTYAHIYRHMITEPGCFQAINTPLVKPISL